MGKLDDIVYSKAYSNPTIDSDDALYSLNFYKDVEYLAPLENFVSFVKSCEKLVRISPDYKKYISFVKGLGLNTCQVLGNIQELDPSDNLIEMHHGPMLTLFDYCAIVINYRLYTNQKINSFIIANIVINEHFAGNVQTIMVSETVHEAIHVPGGPFISLDQGYGDVYGFLKKYKKGVDEDMIYKINRYYETSQKYGTMTKDLFKIREDFIKTNNNFDFI